MDRHRSLALHGGAIAVLFLLQFVLPPYHHTNFTSIMVLATYGIGYNILIGYTGLLSLGHAMFFAAGLYAAGLTVHYFGIDPVSAFVIGALAALAVRDSGRPGRAAHHRRLVHDRHHDVRAGLLPAHPLFQRGDARRRRHRDQRGRAADRRLQPDQSDAAATTSRSRCLRAG